MRRHTARPGNLSARRLMVSLALSLVTLMILGGCAGSKPKTGGKTGALSDDRVDPIAFQYYSIGTIAMSDGDYKTAVAHFERSLRFDPESREIRMSLAECYFRLRDLDRAISIAKAIDPQDAEVLDFLGKCYRYAGREDEAAGAYSRITTLDSNNAAAFWYLSRISLKANRLDDAARQLERAAVIRSDPRVFSEAADVYARMGRPEDALRVYDESLKRDSSASNREAILGKAEALEALQRFDDAVAEYRYAVRLMPEDVGLRKRLVNHYLFTRQADSATAEIKRLLEVAPDDPERLRLGMLWYDAEERAAAESLFTVLDAEAEHYLPPFYLGRIAHDRKAYDTARGYFRRAIAINDSVPDAWIHLISTCMDDDSIPAAVAIADEALEIGVLRKPVLYFMGVTFSRREAFDSAHSWLQRAYNEDTTDTRVQFALAAAAERSGRFDEAVAQFTDLIHREPNNAQALNYLAYTFADSGVRLDESLNLIERAISLDPNNGAYLDSYGWVLYRLGRLDEAEEQIRRALEILEIDPTIHEHLGDILAAKGLREEAKEHWRKALELDPGNFALQSKLE